MTVEHSVRAAYSSRPRPSTWVPLLATAGGLAGAAGLLLVVGFVLRGVTAGGEVQWLTLLAGRTWAPANQIFGAAAMMWGSVAVCVVALGLAMPVGRAAAVALHEQLPIRWARPLRAAVELLAAVPSIVYGLLGIAAVRPAVAELGRVPGGDSLLAAGLVLAVMVLPVVVAVSVDALAAVPDDKRQAAYALGLTRREVVRSVVLPAARPGLRAAGLLALARALGETVAVFLVIGRVDGRLPDSPQAAFQYLLQPGQTLTTKVGGPEPLLAPFGSPHSAALAALALLLLSVVTVATLAGQRAGFAAGGRSRVGSSSRAPRYALDSLVTTTRFTGLAVPLVLLAGILTLIVAAGRRAVDPAFWFTAADGASGGGVRDQLLGTLLLVASTAAVALPAGLGLGLLLSEYTPARLRRKLQTSIVVVGGTPSILLGLAGYAVFSTALGWGKSWLAGTLVLSVLVIPVVVVATVSRLACLPPELRETAAALGLDRPQVARSVLLPYARPAVLTGLLLGLARVTGETAPLLFTATVFSGAASLPSGVTDSPVVALPTHVFALAQDAAEPQAMATAWGTGLVLVMITGVLLLVALPIRRKLEMTP